MDPGYPNRLGTGSTLSARSETPANGKDNSNNRAGNVLFIDFIAVWKDYIRTVVHSSFTLLHCLQLASKVGKLAQASNQTLLNNTLRLWELLDTNLRYTGPGVSLASTIENLKNRITFLTCLDALHLP